VTVKNTSTSALSITGINIGGTNHTQFSQTNNCPTSLAAGASCQIQVAFAPTWVPSSGQSTALLNVEVASPGGSQTVALSGIPAPEGLDCLVTGANR
jgi:hypothetical protein